MNERFKLFAEQAGMGHERWNTTVQFESFLEKFAELIVKECIEVASKYDEPKMSGPGLMIGGMIAEHFGVEE